MIVFCGKLLFFNSVIVSISLFCLSDYLSNTVFVKPELNVLTAQDPVEYTMEGIGQIQANEGIGLSFANILRAFLRQDPEVILVGEIRDKETVDIAIKAVLTGHLLLSTLHTRDAISTIIRLTKTYLYI